MSTVVFSVKEFRSNFFIVLQFRYLQMYSSLHCFVHCASAFDSRLCPREDGLYAWAVPSHIISIISSLVRPTVSLLVEELSSASSYQIEQFSHGKSLAEKEVR